MLFDFVIVYSGSKLYIGAKSDIFNCFVSTVKDLTFIVNCDDFCTDLQCQFVVGTVLAVVLLCNGT